MKINNLTSTDVETLKNLVINELNRFIELTKLLDEKTGLDKLYFVSLLNLKKKLEYALEDNKND